MRWPLLLLLLVFLAAPLGGAAAAPLRLLLVGDSITAGVVAGEGDPYAVQLAGQLGPAWDVANAGCGGASSLDWVPDAGAAFCGSQGIPTPNLYTARAAPELPADVATILLGTNDALGFFEPEPVDPADYGDALAELAFGLLADGASHVLLLTPPPQFDPFADFRLAGYRDAVLALCGGADPGIVCGPDLFTLLDASDFDAGNVHPRLSGHTKIADALHAGVTALVAIPEPGTLPLVAAGLAALAAGRRPRRAGARRRPLNGSARPADTGSREVPRGIPDRAARRGAPAVVGLRGRPRRL